MSASVLDLYGKPLAGGFESSFETAAAVSTDDRLSPAHVRVGYPNAAGLATVTIPALAVPTGSVLVALNNASGATVTAVATASADAALELPAEVGDEIVVFVRQPDGTEYRVSQAAYRRADGFTSVGAQGGTVVGEDGATLLQIPKGAIAGRADIRLTPKAEASIPIPRGEELRNVAVGAGVEIRAAGDFTVEKELHLELPAPAGTEEGRRVAFMRPAKVAQQQGGGELDVWEVITSGRVEGGKFKTNSPPFAGLSLAAGAFTAWVFMPARARTVFGTVTELGERNTQESKPVAGALVVVGEDAAPGAGKVTARTDASGYYATFDFQATAQNGAYVTAIDDRHNRRATKYAEGPSSVEGLFIQGLQGTQILRADIALAPVAGGGPDEQPPAISLEAARLNVPEGEVDTLASLGVVPLGSTVRVTATSSAPLGAVDGHYIIGGSLTGRPLVWARCGDHAKNIYCSDFVVSAEGGYSVVFTGSLRAGDARTATRVTYNFVALRNPNTRQPLDGPPRVLSVTPSDGATGVDTTTDVRLDFTEPVRNLVAGTTLYLEEEGTGTPVGGTITSGGVPVAADTPNVSSVVFRPAVAPVGGRRYCVRVTTGVVDSTGAALDQQFTSAGDTDRQEFRSCFTTFAGLRLTPDAVPDAGRRIAVAGDYAVTVTEGNNGRSTLSVYDVAEPQAPAHRGVVGIPQRAWDVDVAEEIVVGREVYSRVAVVTTSNPLAPEQPANLWVVSLEDPSKPEIVGVAALYLPEQAPSNPIAVRVRGARAYVGNVVHRGVVVVDIPSAISLFKKATEAKAINPALEAVRANAGFGFEARTQTVTQSPRVTDPSPAVSVSVIDQTIVAPSFQGDRLRGSMPVAYVLNNHAHELLSIGFPRSLDGTNGFEDTNADGADDRVLARTTHPHGDSPLWVRALSGVPVGSGRRDLALAASPARLTVYDVTMQAPAKAGDVIRPAVASSRTFEEMGLGRGGAKYLEVEGTLAYVAFPDRVAVVDFSDPSSPRLVAAVEGVGHNLGALAVKDGFIYT
ncbi:MAG: Ig-like domain-containing protein, partial [Pyrinomonadaceae bacterium]